MAELPLSSYPLEELIRAYQISLWHWKVRRSTDEQGKDIFERGDFWKASCPRIKQETELFTSPRQAVETLVQMLNGK